MDLEARKKVVREFQSAKVAGMYMSIYNEAIA